MVQEADYPFLNQLGVKDSKQLDDKKIRLLAPLLMKRLKAKVSILSNTKYNQIYHSDHFNLNVIKSYLHNFLIAKLKEETKFEGPIIIDQFCDEELYFKYLKDYKPMLFVMSPFILKQKINLWLLLVLVLLPVMNS